MALSLPPLSLYIHLPWCVRKCPYCDFNSHALKGDLPEQAYVDALLEDLELDLPRVWGRVVHSVFFGGGTPSLFSAAAIGRILDAVAARLRLSPRAEITLEANPGTVEHDRFEAYRAAGVNRISLGVQSFDSVMLQRLGRIHDGDQARAAVVALIDAGFDILTYLKGKTEHLNDEHFVLRQAQIDGREVAFRLCDQEVSFLEGTLHLRQVTRQSDTGHQTPVLTSRRDLTDIEVAYRMFERWRQENFFKYMRQEFLLDALSDYQVEPDDPTRTVPNPQRRVADGHIKAARTEVARLEQAYGVAADTTSQDHCPTMHGFKCAHEQLGTALHTAREQLKTRLAQRRALPHRVEVRDLSQGAVIKLATERKHLTNLIKMVAFQAESDLLTLLRPHYARADDEGRTLLHELFHAAADLQVTDTELMVTLAPLSSPHRTQAVEAICQLLNDTHTRFPGSPLQLRYAVHSPPVRGLAFPGPRPPRDPVASPQPITRPDSSSNG